MATRNGKPSKRLHQTKSKKSATQSPPPTPALADILGGKLLDIDDHVYHLISCYRFFQASTSALWAGDQEKDDKLLMGLTLTGNWLTEQSDAVLEEIEAVRAWVEEQ